MRGMENPMEKEEGQAQTGCRAPNRLARTGSGSQGSSTHLQFCDFLYFQIKVLYCIQFLPTMLEMLKNFLHKLGES